MRRGERNLHDLAPAIVEAMRADGNDWMADRFLSVVDVIAREWTVDRFTVWLNEMADYLEETRKDAP